MEQINKTETNKENHIKRSFDKLNEYFKALEINSQFTEHKLGKDSIIKYSAGKINNIINNMSVVIVQPYLPMLLYLDTPLFLCDLNSQHKSATSYRYLGKIDDVFGSVTAPMYSVNTTKELINSLKIGDEIYFLPDNPNTQFMYVNNTFNKHYYITLQKNTRT